jgi:hypothetical protein
MDTHGRSPNPPLFAAVSQTRAQPWALLIASAAITTPKPQASATQQLCSATPDLLCGQTPPRHHGFNSNPPAIINHQFQNSSINLLSRAHPLMSPSTPSLPPVRVASIALPAPLPSHRRDYTLHPVFDPLLKSAPASKREEAVRLGNEKQKKAERRWEREERMKRRKQKKKKETTRSKGSKVKEDRSNQK